MSTATRNNPNVSDRPKNPSEKMFTIKGRGEIEVYDNKEKSKLPPIKEVDSLMVLCTTFFWYNYDEKKSVSTTGTEYSMKSDKIAIWERTGKNDKSGKRIKEGTPSELTDWKNDRGLTVGCYVYCFHLGLNEIVRVEMPGSSRTVFMDFQEKSGKYPNMKITLQEVTKEMKKAILAKAGRVVSVPDFIANFEEIQVTEDDVENASAACTVLDNYFAELKGEPLPFVEKVPEGGEEIDPRDPANW